MSALLTRLPHFILLLPTLAAAMRVGRPCMMAADASALCTALQNGEEPADLAEAVSSRKKAQVFFEEFLTKEEFTVADATEPPASLIASLVDAPLESMEVVLLNLVMGAAAADDRKATRATKIVNAIWPLYPQVGQSCEGLKDAVTFASGGEEIFIEDASDGNIELIRSQWGGILAMTDYDDDQYVRVKAALGQCTGPDWEETRERAIVEGGD